MLATGAIASEEVATLDPRNVHEATTIAAPRLPLKGLAAATPCPPPDARLPAPGPSAATAMQPHASEPTLIDPSAAAVSAVVKQSQSLPHGTKVAERPPAEPLPTVTPHLGDNYAASGHVPMCLDCPCYASSEPTAGVHVPDRHLNDAVDSMVPASEGKSTLPGLGRPHSKALADSTSSQPDLEKATAPLASKRPVAVRALQLWPETSLPGSPDGEAAGLHIKELQSGTAEVAMPAANGPLLCATENCPAMPSVERKPTRNLQPGENGKNMTFPEAVVTKEQPGTSSKFDADGSTQPAMPIAGRPILAACNPETAPIPGPVAGVSMQDVANNLLAPTLHMRGPPASITPNGMGSLPGSGAELGPMKASAPATPSDTHSCQLSGRAKANVCPEGGSGLLEASQLAEMQAGAADESAMVIADTDAMDLEV